MGVVRRDSMAMKPFAGYNFADYFGHWLKLGAGNNASKLPKIFHVNWFRQDRNGKLHVARLRREPARAEVGRRPLRRQGRSHRRTPIGLVPRKQDLDISGLNMDAADARDLAVHRPAPPGARKSMRSASTSMNMAAVCRASCVKS